jgi:hypothetical protein
MNAFENIPFDGDEMELGNHLKKKVVAPLKKKAVAPPKSFARNIRSVGQSSNIEDRRTGDRYAGTDTRFVRIFGYFTRNTWWHLASRVPQDIIAALQSRNIGVIYSSANDRDRKNSQYNFQVDLRVFNQYNTNQAVNSVVFTLGQTIALPNSVGIINVFDYKK